MCDNKKYIESLVDRLCTIQSIMQDKALKKDASIIMNVFELDEVINELKEIRTEECFLTVTKSKFDEATILLDSIEDSIVDNEYRNIYLSAMDLLSEAVC